MMRKLLGRPPGIVVVIDWGKGLVERWISAEKDSPLHQFMQEQAAKPNGTAEKTPVPEPETTAP
jgi:hypothetical protein